MQCFGDGGRNATPLFLKTNATTSDTSTLLVGTNHIRTLHGQCFKFVYTYMVRHLYNDLCAEGRSVKKTIIELLDFAFKNQIWTTEQFQIVSFRLQIKETTYSVFKFSRRLSLLSLMLA